MILFCFIYFLKYGTLHEFACPPCAGAGLILSIVPVFRICAAETSAEK